jgi:hypothetical protein
MLDDTAALISYICIYTYMYVHFVGSSVKRVKACRLGFLTHTNLVISSFSHSFINSGKKSCFGPWIDLGRPCLVYRVVFSTSQRLICAVQCSLRSWEESELGLGWDWLGLGLGVEGRTANPLHLNLCILQGHCITAIPNLNTINHRNWKHRNKHILKIF